MASTDPTPAMFQSRTLRLAGRRNDSADIAYRPDTADIATLREDLNLLDLAKLSLSARLDPVGRDGWNLDGTFGATITQPCAITSDPVKTRLDGRFTRRYRADVDLPPAGAETEMPEDDTLEPLAATVDLFALLAEEIALALPLFPRKPGSAFGSVQAAEPGTPPMTDEEVRPFAGLADLRAAMRGENDDKGE